MSQLVGEGREALQVVICIAKLIRNGFAVFITELTSIRTIVSCPVFVLSANESQPIFGIFPCTCASADGKRKRRAQASNGRSMCRGTNFEIPQSEQLSGRSSVLVRKTFT